MARAPSRAQTGRATDRQCRLHRWPKCGWPRPRGARARRRLLRSVKLVCGAPQTPRGGGGTRGVPVRPALAVAWRSSYRVCPAEGRHTSLGPKWKACDSEGLPEDMQSPDDTLEHVGSYACSEYRPTTPAHSFPCAPGTPSPPRFPSVECRFQHCSITSSAAAGRPWDKTCLLPPVLALRLRARLAAGHGGCSRCGAAPYERRRACASFRRLRWSRRPSLFQAWLRMRARARECLWNGVLLWEVARQTHELASAGGCKVGRMYVFCLCACFRACRCR